MQCITAAAIARVRSTHWCSGRTRSTSAQTHLLKCHSSSTVTMARQKSPCTKSCTNHALAKGRHAPHARHTRHGSGSDIQGKKSHMCMPTALSAMQSGEATANVVRYGILIMAMLVTAPWRRRTAQQRARAAPRWLPKGSPMPCRVSRAPDRARHTPRVPCLQANREQSTTAHECGGRSMCRRSMRASDHTLHPSGKWGQAFRLESASIIWGKKIM